jgi:hypothetical protein
VIQIERLHDTLGEKIVAEEGTAEQLYEILSILIYFFDELQVSEAKPLLKELKQKNWPQEHWPALAHILEEAEHYRYPAAAQQARDLLYTLS